MEEGKTLGVSQTLNSERCAQNAEIQPNVLRLMAGTLRGIKIEEEEADTAKAGHLFKDFLNGPRYQQIAHQCTTFHPFPRLPVELRLEIWRLSRSPPQTVKLRKRTIQIDGNTYPRAVYSTTPIPGILQANQESRTFALEHWYPLNDRFWFFPNTQAILIPGTITFYFDPAHDYAYIGSRQDQLHAQTGHLISSRRYRMWPSRVREFTTKLMANRAYSQGFMMPAITPFAFRDFPAAKELIFLNPYCPSSYIGKRTLGVNVPQIEDLVPSAHTFRWQVNGESPGVGYRTAVLQMTALLNDNIPPHYIEKVSTMELAVSPRNTSIHGFMDYKFKNMHDLRALLQQPIPGVFPSEVKDRTQKIGLSPREFIKGRRIRPQNKWQVKIDEEAGRVLQQVDMENDQRKLARGSIVNNAAEELDLDLISGDTTTSNGFKAAKQEFTRQWIGRLDEDRLVLPILTGGEVRSMDSGENVVSNGGLNCDSKKAGGCNENVGAAEGENVGGGGSVYGGGDAAFQKLRNSLHEVARKVKARLTGWKGEKGEPGEVISGWKNWWSKQR